MIAEEEDVGLFREALFLEGIEYAADVPIQVLDHRVIAGEIFPGGLLDTRNSRYVRSEPDGLRQHSHPRCPGTISRCLMPTSKCQNAVQDVKKMSRANSKMSEPISRCQKDVQMQFKMSNKCVKW